MEAHDAQRLESQEGMPLHRLDLIVPCYNEEANVVAFHQEFCQAFSDCAIPARLVMVDDGSKDATFAELRALAARDPRVTVIRFSRNFGKEAAIYAGLEHSDAEFVGIIDADLQQPPAVARAMLEKLVSDDELDCVAAYQEQRREGALMRFMKNRFYKVFAKASRTDTVANASDFRVFRRKVADAILSMTEYHRFSKGIFAWIGFNTLPWPYTPDKRTAGESKWTFGSLLRYAFEGLMSFTTAPLHFITTLGFVVSIIAVLYALVLIVRTLILGIDLPGYASTLCFILLFGGGQFFAIGILGEYLGRAYIQGKRRPIYIVKDALNDAAADTRESEGRS